jgi:OOP family OmpA-OmpF porin
MNATRSFLLASCLVLSTLGAACATAPSPIQSGRTPQLPDAGPDGQYQVRFPDLGRGKARYIRLTIGDDRAPDCGVSLTHFAFDSAEPLPPDTFVLRSLAECVNQPTYRGLDLSLVGRADSRGSAAYNRALGLQRAKRAKEILVGAGVASDRITITSEGEARAVGDDVGAYSFGYDRRVDAALVGVVHAPR